MLVVHSSCNQWDGPNWDLPKSEEDMTQECIHWDGFTRLNDPTCTRGYIKVQKRINNLDNADVSSFHMSWIGKSKPLEIVSTTRVNSKIQSSKASLISSVKTYDFAGDSTEEPIGYQKSYKWSINLRNQMFSRPEHIPAMRQGIHLKGL
jgi:hypothetical protein